MKKILCILLAAFLILGGCTGQPEQSSLPADPAGVSAAVSMPEPEPEPKPEPAVTLDQPPADRVEIPFSEMVYVQPDLEETIASYEKFTRRIQNAGSADDVMAVWQEEAALCREYYNMYTLSNILFSLDTSHGENAGNYQYMQDFLTKLRPYTVQMTRAILQSPFRPLLEDIVGGQVLEAMEVDTEYYTEDQLELQLEENQLTTQYTQLLSQTPVYETQEYTFTTSDMYYFIRYGEEADQRIASHLLEEYYSTLNRECGDIFEKLVDLRTRQAQLAGFEDYLDYYYHTNSYRGYGREEIEAFRGWVKEHLVPVYLDLKRQAETRLGQPLDLFSYTSPLAAQVNVSYREDIESETELLEIVIGILQDLSPETREMIDYMTRNELYDLFPAANKSSGAFTTYFYGWQEPFVFSSYSNAGTYIHEMGHALNFFRTGNYLVLEQDLQGADISEIHSQALELLATPYLGRIYIDGEAAELDGVFEMFLNILSASLIDEFQHEIYEDPDMNLEERNALYERLEREYFGLVDNRGLSHLDNGMDWVDIHHLFESPMYYIEYALSGVVALNFWQDSKSDWDGAFRQYIYFLDIPNDQNLPDSLAIAGMEELFSEDTIARLARQLQDYFPAA